MDASKPPADMSERSATQHAEVRTWWDAVVPPELQPSNPQSCSNNAIVMTFGSRPDGKRLVLGKPGRQRQHLPGPLGRQRRKELADILPGILRPDHGAAGYLSE